MKYILVRIYKLLKRLKFKLSYPFNQLVCKVIFWLNNISFGKFSTMGLPFISVSLGGECKLGNNLVLNNTISSNPIGRHQRCIFFVKKGAKLIIGNNVGLSHVALVCHEGITIEDNVKIGGGVCIYDTDFHSLDPLMRMDPKSDFEQTNVKKVLIKKNAFIGAHSTILKGITIGENSIIGACSLITNDVPNNEIWGGNPAKMIKKISL